MARRPRKTNPAPAEQDQTAASPAPVADSPATAIEATDQGEKTTPPEQTVQVQDVGPARKRLTIEIPAHRIAAKLEEHLGRFRQEATIPGFRRGRAPRRLIEKRFGTTLRQEVRDQLISESYQQAIEQLKLEVVGEPEVKDLEKLELPEEGPLKLEVEVEVAPTFELPDLSGIEIKKPKVQVTPAMVDAEIAQLQQRFAQFKPAPAGALVQAGDWLEVDLRILAGEQPDPAAEPLVHHPAAFVRVPGPQDNFKGQLAGIAVENLGKLLEAKKAGDSLRIPLQGPPAHEDDRIAGKPITILLTIERVLQAQPAPLETVAQQLGLDSPAALQDRVRQMLEARQQRAQHRAMHEQICQYLLEKVPMELPTELSRRQTARILHRQALDMAMRGMSDEQIQQKLAELRAGSEQEAARRLKLFFILDRAAKQLQVEVSEAEVNGLIAMLALQQGRRPEKLRQEMIRSGQIEQVYLEVRDSKTLDAILAKAKIIETDEPVVTAS